MRVGVVEREDVTFSGREARKALSMLIVRGTCFFCMTFDQYFRFFEVGKRKGKGKKLTPLNPIHFNPTSLISSAVCTASPSGEAAWYSSDSESGEFIVMVVAVYYTSYQFLAPSLYVWKGCVSHTAMDNQAGTPTPLAFASLAKFW